MARDMVMDHLNFGCLILLVHLTEDEPHVAGHLIRGVAGVGNDGHEGGLCRRPESDKANILPEKLRRPSTARGFCVALGPLGILFSHLDGLFVSKHIFLQH